MDKEGKLYLVIYYDDLEMKRTKHLRLIAREGTLLKFFNEQTGLEEWIHENSIRRMQEIKEDGDKDGRR
jgi:hypothetical protein